MVATAGQAVADAAEQRPDDAAEGLRKHVETACDLVPDAVAVAAARQVIDPQQALDDVDRGDGHRLTAGDRRPPKAAFSHHRQAPA
jgi:hypothetical protein